MTTNSEIKYSNSNPNLKNTIQIGSNVNFQNHQTVNITNRPPVSSRPASSRRPKSSKPSTDEAIKPVKHEPCSSTLAKFHDSVNNSLMYENSGGISSRSRQNNVAHPPIHPIIEAKQKYKYMLNQKSYVDESLFGGSGGNLMVTPRSTTPNNFFNNYNNGYEYVNQNLNNHLTHNLMSNMTPLIINARPRSASASGSARASARPVSARQQEQSRALDDANVSTSKLIYQRPWRP
jgi:hypothetical protein